MLRWIILLVCTLATVSNPLTAKGEFFLRDGDVYVIYGDSITHFSVYARMIENYVLTRFPTWRIRFYNVGWGGDTANNIARFKRDVLSLHPTAFSDLMGMNDGGYSFINTVTTRTYANAYRQTIPLLRESNPAIRIALISAIPNETIGSLAAADGAYAQTLRYLAQIKSRLAREYNVSFIDLYTGYGQAMGLGKVVYPDFLLSDDGIHPNAIGQTIMGMIILEGMGGTPQVADVMLDIVGPRPRVIRQSRCQIRDLNVSDHDVITFRRLAESLPCPIEATGEMATRFLDVANFSDRINRDVLCIQGLKHPAYELQINNVPISVYSPEELRDGVNISAPMKGPLWAQARTVMEVTQERQLTHFIKWQKVLLKKGPFGEYDLSDRSKQAEYDAQLKRLIDRQHLLAQPQWMNFSLIPVSGKPVSLPEPVTFTRCKKPPPRPTPLAPWDWTKAKTKTIDLRSVANRGFTDPVAYDGQGGWSDQGPRNDLSCFPHGKQVLAGVLADVIDPASNGGRSMVVLSRRAGLGAASQVSIPVGFKAKTLAFLHTAAWIDEDQPPVQVALIYEDNQKTQYEFVPTVHLMDWWGLPQSLPQGVCAWSGKNQSWEIRAIWTPLVNPHPDRIVREIHLYVPEEAFWVYGLIGITALE